MKDFLKTLQDRYFILVCFFVTLGIYIFIRLDAILQLAINFGVAIIALSQKKQDPPPPPTDKIETPSVSVESETVNVSEQPKGE